MFPIDKSGLHCHSWPKLFLANSKLPFESWTNPSINGALRDDAETQALLREHGAIYPTGDPVTDARTFEAFNTKGQFASHIKDTYSALRHLVAMRQGYTEELSKGGLFPVPQIVIPKRIEVLDRLLTYYGVKSRMANDFDQEWEQRAKQE